MLDKIKQEAMRRGMKLMSNPKVMKMMADPRFMQLITKGFALRGKVQSEVDARLRAMASTLNLVSRQDFDALRRSLRQVESAVTSLQKKVEAAQAQQQGGDGA